MAPKKEYRILPLAHDRYRLITTITVEDVVTADKLRELGLDIPVLDLPWVDGAAPVRVWRDGQKPRNPDASAAMDYWLHRVGGATQQLKSRMPTFVNKLSLASVREAIDIVATHGQHMDAGDKYLMLVRVLKQITERGDGK